MAKSPGPEIIDMSPSPSHQHSPPHKPIPSAHLLHGQSLSSALGEAQSISRHRPLTPFDAESQGDADLSPADDPLGLKTRLKTRSELDSITANTSRKRDHYNPLVLAGKVSLSKVADFYENQNGQIERLLKPVHEHVRQARETRIANHLTYNIAVYGSFAANIILAILQVYGAVASGSLSLFTTMADAIFDPLSNVTLIACNKAVQKVDAREYPSGKSRIETAGNIVFCFLMTAVSFILIAFSCHDLATHKGGGTTAFHLAAVIAVAIAFATKLSLFIYCFALRNQYSQIRILWEDHRNDLLINGFGVLTSVGGSKLRWWIDPMGAIILSVLIAVLWLSTAYSEFQLLIGKSADPEMLQLFTYVSMNHSEKVKAIDTVRAWHSGPRVVVEVDIVMDPEKSLQECHDIAEELQTKLESLPDVERAYVHIDYETTHKPEHFLKKEL